MIAHDARRQRVAGDPSWRSWISRHSRRSRAATPGGSNSWMRASTRSTISTSGQVSARNAISSICSGEVAVLVDVADDHRADLLLRVGEVGQPELPDQVVGQRASRLTSMFSSAARVLVVVAADAVPTSRGSRCCSSRGTPSSRSRRCSTPRRSSGLRVGLVLLAVVGRSGRRRCGISASPRLLLVDLSSRTGFSVSSWSMSGSSSARDTCRILIACRSWGVITSCWESLCWRRCAFRAPSCFVRILQTELLAEVHLAGPPAGGDAGGDPFFQHRALVQDVGAVADPECFAHVVVRDQDADASVP